MGRIDFTSISRDGLAWLESAAFQRERWLLHAFSTRRGGASAKPAAGLNLGFTGRDTRARVETNRRRFLRALGARGYSLASLRQIHSAHVFYVTREASGELKYRPSGLPRGAAVPDGPPAGDALVTDQPGILLTVRVADCLPVLLADPGHRVVAAVHAGWRGALARVISKTAGEMRRLFGSDPRKCLAALGPSIRACCYEVGEEVVETFAGRFARAEIFFRRAAPLTAALEDRYPLLFLSARPPGHEPARRRVAFLDLVAVAREELLDAGFLPRRIHVADFCTACRTDLFFSHRKEGQDTGRLMGVMGIRPEARQGRSARGGRRVLHARQA